MIYFPIDVVKLCFFIPLAGQEIGQNGHLNLTPQRRVKNIYIGVELSTTKNGMKIWLPSLYLRFRIKFGKTKFNFFYYLP